MDWNFLFMCQKYVTFVSFKHLGNQCHSHVNNKHFKFKFNIFYNKTR